MEFHEIANIFPMITGEDYQALHEDIKDNGLIHPIVLYENKILDGRNRYAACLEVTIEPEYIKYTGDDPLGYVISSNLKRRHLNESQRGMIAARLANMERGRPETNGSIDLFISQTQATKMMNVSTPTVKRSKKVLESERTDLMPIDTRLSQPEAAKMMNVSTY